MQRRGFNNGSVDDSFGLMATGLGSARSADTALTGSAVSYHTFAVRAGGIYEIRATAWIDVTTIGNLFVGINPSSGTPLIGVSLTGRLSNTGVVSMNSDRGNGLQQAALSWSTIGVMNAEMSGVVLPTEDINVSVTYAITGGAVASLLTGSKATCSRIG